MQGSGIEVYGLGFRDHILIIVSDFWLRVRGLGSRVQQLWFGVHVSGCKVIILGFGVHGLGRRV